MKRTILVVHDFLTSSFWVDSSFYPPPFSLFKPHCPCGGIGQLDWGYYILYFSFSKTKSYHFKGDSHGNNACLFSLFAYFIIF
jgi:hypothetical protein